LSFSVAVEFCAATGAELAAVKANVAPAATANARNEIIDQVSDAEQW
jgi:hypothetical protein